MTQLPCLAFPPFQLSQKIALSQTTHAIILTDSVSLQEKGGMGGQDLHVSALTSTFGNSSGCTALDMLEGREMTKQIDWQAKQPLQVVCILEYVKC